MLVAALSILAPSSGSVLCIAPGSHIAIEDINAECCASAHSPAMDAHGRDQISATIGCVNCTDFALTPFEREAIQKPQFEIQGTAQTNEFAGSKVPAEFSPSLFRQGPDHNTDLLIADSSSVPLRC
jgi:hypothetical protein